ncbi:MAG: Magnesium transporter MgtE [Planctomycetes bacterium]|nr:Magnesium transporter MgtE [Planctomycetota bacterium]
MATDTTRLQGRLLDHASRDFVAIRDADTVAQALEGLRTRKLAERIVYFYATDGGGKLVGVVPTRALLMAASDRKIADIMVRNVVTLPDTATVSDACDFFLKRRFLAIPIVDAEGRILAVADVGLFTDDIQSALERREDSELFQMIGLHLETARKTSPFAGFLSRFPWLLANIAGGLACAVVAARYEKFLAVAVVISLFVPVVLALSESVSIQAMTLTLQKLRGDKADWGGVMKAMGAEAVTATMLGTACGVLVGLAAWLWRGQLDVAVVIAATIAASMLTACMIGVALPAVVKMLRGDPKIAAGPIVLATGDIVTLIFYFNLAMRAVSTS